MGLNFQSLNIHLPSFADCQELINFRSVPVLYTAQNLNAVFKEVMLLLHSCSQTGLTKLADFAEIHEYKDPQNKVVWSSCAVENLIVIIFVS